MAKYNSYIELSPHYESVVDIDSESRHPDMWQEYIVHEDMKEAIEKICDSMKYEDEDKRRSFWIHGAYGTGKSYAAIVLKHLFEDSVDSIRKFLSNQMLIPYRESSVTKQRKRRRRCSCQDCKFHLTAFLPRNADQIGCPLAGTPGCSLWLL